MGSEITLWDWMRIMIGNVPWSFFIEVVIRTIFLYFLLILSMRLLGKRMAAQLNRNELATMTTLAAAIGVPLQAPDRGLIPPVIIAIIVVLIGRLVAFLSSKNQRFEDISQGDIEPLIKDSILQLPHMEHSRISRERIYSQLRSKKITHLGEVKRLYIEANGSFTLIKEEKPSPGLSILPEWDKEFRQQQKPSGDMVVCKNCGNRRQVQNPDQLCTNCGQTEWIPADMSIASLA
jgi:uncharacterized membrane protein YcaP (DUF421 family)